MEGRSMLTGKVLLVPFPFDVFSNSKVRPAVCLPEVLSLTRDHSIVEYKRKLISSVLIFKVKSGII
jgi:hypothetical protein